MSARGWKLPIAVTLANLLCQVPGAAQESGSLVMWGQRALPDPAEVHDVIAVAAGVRASLALRADGRILAWGDGPLVVIPEPNAEFTGLWAGEGGAVGLREDGSLCAWGSFSTSSIPEPNSGFVKVAVGRMHCLGLKSDGSIVAWGHTGYGECSVPQPNSNWVDIAAGIEISMGLKSDGSIAVWGDNSNEDLTVPLPNDDFVGMATGGWQFYGPGINEYSRRNMVGVKSDGRLVVWGAYGFLVPELSSGFSQIDLSRSTAIGTRPDGSMVVWSTYDGVITRESEPGVSFVDGALCADHGIWLREDGSVELWGPNSYGQSGLGEPNLGFVEMEYFSDSEFSLLVAQREDGTLLSLGDAYHAPDLVVTTFALSSDHGLCVTPAGQVVTWGENALPPPPPNENFVAVATGNHEIWVDSTGPHDWGYWNTVHHDVALREDGTLVAWGDNQHGQCDIPSPNADFVAVDAASTFSVALDADGFVHCWGTLPDLFANGGIIAIDAGPDFCLALRGDGSVVAWGDNSLGQCLVPEPNSGFVAISAGRGAALGIQADGSIVSWGAYAEEPPAPNAGFLDAKMWDGRCFGIRRSEVPVIPPQIHLLPAGLVIRSGFPNPFNPMIHVTFELQQPTRLNLAVFNVAGQQVLKRALGDHGPGLHATQWDGRGQDGRNLASGTYFIRLADDQGHGSVIPCLLQR